MPNRTPLYTIGAASLQLIRCSWPDNLADGDTTYVGALQQVRVFKLPRGPNHPPCLLYVGFLSGLNFDPDRWIWKDKTPLLAYTAKQGRVLLQTCRTLTKTILDKWRGLLPQTFQAAWQDVWRLARP
ncbi:hypothetical protein KC19_4G067700 [Ceratodon purpureus]|uniref:Uncharacterized protein n=1 Tax=Ceratodon purpureus TaxID=3225 RepID=A0A8T0I5V3_CERPU|nr:hypothetical protein KC19_4G067700 [Ceratodon purpureus]